MKICFKCNTERPLSEFYKHSSMADGHLNKCKSCTKQDASSNRLANIEFYREYDRGRGNRQDSDYFIRYRYDNPDKYKATTAVNNAVRDGRLKRQPCEICGDINRIHAHHDDYSKPLDVRWLCSAHHRQWHIKNGEANV